MTNQNVESETGNPQDLAEDELSEDELVEGELVEDELVEGELSEDELVEDELSEDELVEGELSEDELSEDELVEGELSEDEFSEDELSEDELGEQDLTKIFEVTQRIRRPMQLYIGLFISAIVLALGVIVLLTDLKDVFTSGTNISISSDIVFKVLLLIFCIYGSVASFTAILKLEGLQKLLVKKVDESFKDFVIYARPLIEEIIKNRLIQEQLLSKLDQKFKSDEIISEKMPVHVKQEKSIGREEFLVLVSVLGMLNVGLFIYLDEHPYDLVPYSLIILALSWWALFASHFKVAEEVRSYYLPGAFVLIVPTLSIVLRAYTDPFKVLYVVFVILYLYVVVLYSYLKYMATGEAVISPKRFKKFLMGASDKPKEPTDKESE